MKLLAALSCLLSVPLLSPLSAAEAANAQVLEVRTISQDPWFYHGWPTLTRRESGELWVVFSGGRAGHICPFGQVSAITSKDEGKSWSRSRVVYDSPMDDRDSGILETAKGTLIVSTFTSLAYEPMLEKAEKDHSWTPEKLALWKATQNQLPPEVRRAQLGEWTLRSVNGGMTWSNPIRSLVNSPHGPIQLKDGRLLYAGKKLWTPDNEIGVCEPLDAGPSWQWLATIPTRTGDAAARGYHELHAVEAADGTIVVQIRNHNPSNALETLQTESSDGGKSWTEPHSIGVWGMPSHLMRLRDGRLLMTYGHRRVPFGNQARLSTDNGKTWGDPILISNDGIGGDLGYPSTVELPDDSLLTVWYESMKDPKLAVLRQAHWRLP